VKHFVGANGDLVEEFTEDEAAHQRQKPHFEAALRSAKRHHATLVIPRFRAIQKSAAFVDRLRDAGVDFVALDMPAATPTTIASLAARAAQHRRDLSNRIKSSLQAAKARGTRLGNPDLALARPKAVQAARDAAQEIRQALQDDVVRLRKEGRSLRAIADKLNGDGIPSARGRQWHASAVRKILAEGAQ
jgi:DNA invertase Pin-like site-specific DNA recombinase